MITFAPGLRSRCPVRSITLAKGGQTNSIHNLIANAAGIGVLLMFAKGTRRKLPIFSQALRAVMSCSTTRSHDLDNRVAQGRLLFTSLLASVVGDGVLPNCLLHHHSQDANRNCHSLACSQPLIALLS